MALTEALDTTRTHRVAGRTGDLTAFVTTRPFRAPHHTISDVGLIGGGQVPTPGEMSRAHHGVLFLDELPSSGAMLPLALNLVLTGAFILLMTWLVARDRTPASAALVPSTHSRPQA